MAHPFLYETKSTCGTQREQLYFVRDLCQVSLKGNTSSVTVCWKQIFTTSVFSQFQQLLAQI